ncbi:MAG: YgfZ/GcvT domain-containing protein [Solirubrobacterales bacterium]
MGTSADPVVELDGEYRLLREGAGLVDRSPRGKLAVTGPDAVAYLQGQLTNDLEALARGEGCYAALLDRKGHMQADMRVLRLDPDGLWLDLEPLAAPAATRHLSLYRVGQEVEIADRADAKAILSVIGPGSASVSGVEGLSPEHAHREVEVAGIRCRAVATDQGIDLICDRERAERLALALVEAGAARVSDGAAEIVRVESGRPRFGREMTEATIPQEAAIDDRAVSFTKGCYIGQETVARLHYKGRPNRRLRGMRLDGPVTDGEPIALEDREVGSVGTAVISPALGPIALAVIRREAEPGARVRVGDRGVGAEVVELPF